MNQSNDLYSLINSLTSTEKRYFRRFAGLHSSEKDHQYIALFDAILQTENPSDEILKSQFSGTGIGKHFSFAKNHLFNQILKSLEIYHYDRSVEMKIRSALTRVELLFNRNLKKQADRILKRVKKLAIKYERFRYIPEINTWERKLIKEFRQRDRDQKIGNSYEEELQMLKSIEREVKVFHQHDRYFSAVEKYNRTRDPQLRSELDEILDKDSIMIDRSDEFRIKLLNHLTAAYSIGVSGDVQRSTAAYEKVVSHWEGHPHMIDEEPEGYFRAVYLFLSAQDPEEIKEPQIARLRSIRNRRKLSPHTMSKLFDLTYNLELLYYLNQYKFDKALQLVPDLEKGLKDMRDHISPTNEIVFYYNISLIYILIEDFSKALKWIQKIMDLPSGTPGLEIQRMARILYLIIQYELGNLDILPALILSSYRFLKKVRDLNEFERKVLRSLRSLERTLSSRKKAQVLKQLNADILKIERYTPNPIFGILEIKCWVDSRLRNIPLRESFRILNESD